MKIEGKKVIEGKRIVLRPWRKGDAEEIALLVNDKSISRFTRVPSNYRLKDAKEFLRRTMADFRKGKSFQFAVIRKEDSGIVGNIDLKDVNNYDKKAEIGYLLGKEHRGKGFMSESVELVLGFAFGKLKLNRVRISCSIRNRASRRVIERTGARFEGIERESIRSGDGKMHDVRVYSILKREFKRKDI